jgi:hypothetical protein
MQGAARLLTPITTLLGLPPYGAVQVFGLSLTWHAYLSVMISQRARSLLPMLNPVSSGIVQL